MVKFKVVIVSIIATIFIGIIVCSVFTFSYWLPWFGIFVNSYFGPNPPEPEITYSEFPLRLEYQIADEIKVIEDTLVCEFDGFKVVGESGKKRVWKSYLKSGNERITLLDLSDRNVIDDWGKPIIELYFYFGNAEYFMGDNSHTARSNQNFDFIQYIYKAKDGNMGGSALKADKAWEMFQIRLVKWEASPPVQNSFK